MLDLTGFDAIIFDMDGTLIDSMGVHIKAWEATCHHFGYPFDADYQYGLGGVPSVQTAELMNAKYAKNDDPFEVAAYKQHVFERLGNIPPLISDTFQIFEHYKTTLPIAVGTGADKQHAKWLLSHYGLLEQLGALVTADDVRHGKPHPETFLKAAEQLQVAPQHCVVFEDTEMGRKAAIDAGMQCIMVVNTKVQLP